MNTEAATVTAPSTPTTETPVAARRQSRWLDVPPREPQAPPADISQAPPGPHVPRL